MCSSSLQTIKVISWGQWFDHRRFVSGGPRNRRTFVTCVLLLNFLLNSVEWSSGGRENSKQMNTLMPIWVPGKTGLYATSVGQHYYTCYTWENDKMRASWGCEFDVWPRMMIKRPKIGRFTHIVACYATLHPALHVHRSVCPSPFSFVLFPLSQLSHFKSN